MNSPSIITMVVKMIVVVVMVVVEMMVVKMVVVVVLVMKERLNLGVLGGIEMVSLTFYMEPFPGS